jgi:hypothetical protein
VFLGSQTDPEIVARADVNGDRVVNVLDVQAIVNLFLGQENALALLDCTRDCQVIANLRFPSGGA